MTPAIGSGRYAGSYAEKGSSGIETAWGNSREKIDSEESVADILESFDDTPLISLALAMSLIARQMHNDRLHARASLNILGYFLLRRGKQVELVQLIAHTLETEFSDSALGEEISSNT
ncbi:MAG: hypothetical protein MUC96_12760 [Myxococcaceae bacterium]|jgi:hypothetical protein|nr:hypothetical protein [Myxococcaceae bacterium]